MDSIAETFKQHWTAYAQAYSTAAEDERIRLLEGSVCDDVVFTNPGGEGKSRAGLSAHIANFQNAMPGAYFSTERLLVHHNELLVVWSAPRFPPGTISFDPARTVALATWQVSFRLHNDRDAGSRSGAAV
jgi:hypothetical protein